MSNLEQALRELEIATAAVAGLSLEDIGGAHAALKRRSKAIAQVAGFRYAVLILPATEFQEVASRLESAAKAGEEARQQLVRAKGAVASEWGRWNHVRRALGPVALVENTIIDCRG